MKPSFRRRVNKGASAASFRRNSYKTKAANIQRPQRGGFRL